MFEPQPFGKYTLLRRLAVGGMAELFLAHHAGRAGGSVVVVKRILPAFAADRDFMDMFIDEARVAANLWHECVVRVFDFG